MIGGMTGNCQRTDHTYDKLTQEKLQERQQQQQPPPPTTTTTKPPYQQADPPRHSHREPPTLAFSTLPPTLPPPRLLLLLLLQLLLSSLFLFLVTASTARFWATATAAAAAAGENSAAAVKAGKNFTPYITAAAAGFQPPFPHTAPGGSAAAVGKRIARETVKERVCMASSSFSPEAAAAAAVEETRPPSILPKAIIFDLDATLWTPELYEISGRPFRRLERAGKGKGKGKGREAPAHHHIIVDRRGSQIDLFPEARLVLEELATHERWQGVTLGLASRTDCVQDAHELLEMIHITPTLTMADLFPRRVRQIFPGNKRTHFQNLHKDTRIPCRDMAFWDDWDLNCRDVGKLGVHCFHVPSGLNLNRWRKALEKYAEKKEEEGW